ncbi:GIY-YIG nuclease family protein [Micromonospora tulbaghiae]|uniref:GIY-YIG nuclease family protein n=1 Tax=Micromonospora tulbaghiae TaxID=479978 RepID=UPI0034010D67
MTSRRAQTSLYRLFDADRRLLYIGITLNIGSRWKTHSGQKPDWSLVAHAEVEHLPTREAALAAERAAIQAEKPAWNVIHNRDPKPLKRLDPPRSRTLEDIRNGSPGLVALGRERQELKARHQAAVQEAKRLDAARLKSAAVVEALRKSLHEQIVADGRARRPLKEIIDITGYTPERVRQILRAAGVEPFERETRRT